MGSIIGFSNYQVESISLAFSGSTPYVAYIEGEPSNGYKARLMRFDGTNWVAVDAGGFSSGEAFYISLAFSGSTPYLAYRDRKNDGKATLMKFDGTNWGAVGEAGLSAGEPGDISLAFKGSTPYVAYDDTIGTTVQKFDLFSETAAVASGSGNGSLRIFPTQTRGMVSAASEKAPVDLIEAFDLDGRLLMKKAAAAQLDLSALPAGMYLIKARAAGETAVQQVFKE